MRRSKFGRDNTQGKALSDNFRESVISSESVKVLYFHCLDNQTQMIGFRLSYKHLPWTKYTFLKDCTS